MFHWVCLDKYARSLPNDTAPAGYTCPICNECIFPLDNLVSPVADALRGLLSDVNWARAGLGLPLLEERREKKPEFSIPSGPRLPPEGESVNSNSSLKDGNMFSRYYGLKVRNLLKSTSHKFQEIFGLGIFGYWKKFSGCDFKTKG